MIVVQNTHDAQCWPCAPQNLRRLLTSRRGSDSDLRVWFTQNAMHIPTGPRVPEGPVPVGEGQERLLLRGPRAVGAGLSAALHAAAGVRSAHRAKEPVRVQVDPLELL